MKLTDEQKTKIKETKRLIEALQEVCDAQYLKMLTNIGFKEFFDSSGQDLNDCRTNPEHVLFDIIFNSIGAELDEKQFSMLEQAAVAYTVSKN